MTIDDEGDDDDDVSFQKKCCKVPVETELFIPCTVRLQL
jgi:hypothetical protein